MATVEINGVELYYEQVGQGDRSPHRSHPDDYTAMLTAFIDTVTADSGSRS